MLSVATVVGARPQFIKASVVSQELRCLGSVHETLIHTGQHFDPNMSAVFFEDLAMAPPSFDLGISGGSHGAMTGRMLEAIERVLVQVRPDLVVVYGDTNSTLAGALAAVKLRVPVAHVEAGLRSFNVSMPEEINRILTDRISRWLFAPTETAVRNLIREGTADEHVVRVGDVMFDVALRHAHRAGATKILEVHGLARGGYVLATIHRAENTDVPARLRAIVGGLVGMASRLRVVLPLHPRTRDALHAAGLLEDVRRALTVIDPVSYTQMAALQKHAAVIATDSGGVQKEAFFHRVPCVTVRDETEWVELIEAGWNRLAPPTDASAIEHAITNAIGSNGNDVDLFGTGDAARQIAAHLVAR